MRHALPLLALLGACATSPPSRETLPQLRQAIETQVASEEQNRKNSELVSFVNREKQLHGLTRAELEATLGRGERCDRHPLCAKKGFFEDDWYYEIGRPGGGYMRYRPTLIVGFNRFGKVERTYVLEVR